MTDKTEKISSKNQAQIPILNRVTSDESKAIAAMFRMYDFNSSGKISPHYARKLLKSLGLSSDTADLPFNVTLSEFLLVVDTHVPLPTPSLPCSLYTFDRLVAKKDPADGKMRISADGISDFMVCVGRQRVPEGTSQVLLFKMLESDDCSLNPAVKVDHFDREVISFAKKNHIYKNADYEAKKNQL